MHAPAYLQIRTKSPESPQQLHAVSLCPWHEKVKQWHFFHSQNHCLEAEVLHDKKTKTKTKKHLCNRNIPSWCSDCSH